MESLGYHFAVVGNPLWIDQNAGGHYLYGNHTESSGWKLLRSSPPSVVPAQPQGHIRFQGNMSTRSFFTLEDNKAYATDFGGSTFTRIADRPFQTEVARIGTLAFAVFGDTLHISADTGLSWSRTPTALEAVQLVAFENQLFARGSAISRSGDSGRTWQDHMDGLPPGGASGSGIYGLHIFGDRLVASTAGGSYSTSATASPWSPMGAGYGLTRRVFSFWTTLLAQANQRLHSYSPEFNAWQEISGWGPGKPMGNINFGSLAGIAPFLPHWIVGNEQGLMAFDPGRGDFAWFDDGIHRAPYTEYGALSGVLVAVHRSQLLEVPPGGPPSLLRDFRKGGTPSGNISLVSTEPADSILWGYADSTLVRLQNFDGDVSAYDYIRVESGKWFCHGLDIIGVTRIRHPLPGWSADSAQVRVSRDGGETFRELYPRLRIPDVTGFPALAGIAAAFIRNDSVFVWDADPLVGDADYHAFDLASDGYRFGETTLPPHQPAGNIAYPLQALSTESGLVVKQGGRIRHSGDGGLTWTLKTQGIPEAKAEGSRIQKHAGRLYLAAGDTLYHAAESDLQWSGIDLKGPAGASGGVAGAMVSREGVYVQRGGEDVVLLSWTNVPVSARPIVSKRSTGRKDPSSRFRRGKGMIFLRNGVGHSIEGRVIERPRSP